MTRGSRSLAGGLALGLVQCLALGALASPARAEPRSGDARTPSERDRQVARELVNKAIERSQAGDHDAAIEIYLQAYTLVPNSLLLSNIGAEFQQAGMPDEALKYFCMYLERDPAGTNAPYATAQVKQLHRQLGRGKRASDACRNPDPPAAPPSDGAVEPAPRGGSAPLRYVGITAGAAGAIALGLGVYYGWRAKDISDEISAHPQGTTWVDIRTLESRGQHYENLQVGFLIGGGVLGTTGVVLYLLGRPDSAPDRSDKLSLTVTPTGHGFAVSGRF